jgi:phage regulator Rha-like protein
MNEMQKPHITMTVQQIAEVAGIPKQTVRNAIRQLFPHILRHGKKTVLNESESKQIMTHIRKKNYVEHVQNGQVHVQNGQLENRNNRGLK